MKKFLKILFRSSRSAPGHSSPPIRCNRVGRPPRQLPPRLPRPRSDCVGGRRRVGMTSLSGAVDWAGSGGAAQASLCPSALCTMSVSCLIARRSAAADLLTSWVTISSRLVTRRRRPSSVTMTFSSSAWATKVARFFEPFGRPLGLPERPFWKPAWRGGLP
jgi:hypothetical protein